MFDDTTKTRVVALEYDPKCNAHLPWSLFYGWGWGGMTCIDSYTSIEELLEYLRSVPSLVQCRCIGMYRRGNMNPSFYDTKYLISDITSDAEVLLTMLRMED